MIIQLRLLPAGLAKRANAIGAGLLILGLIPFAHAAIPAELTRWLPPETLVNDVLQSSMLVRQAQRQADLEVARARQLGINPYEWTVNGTLQRRRDNEASKSFLEQSVSVQRGFRWANKAELDRQIGDAGLRVAHLTILDARHEAARTLLNDWFDAMGDLARARRLGDQVKLLNRQVRVAAQRYRAGDAPRLEQMTLDNERNQMLAQQQQAQGSAERRLSRLRYLGLDTMPDVRVMEQVPVLLPVRLVQAEQERLSDNHELQLVQAEAERSRLQAERLKLDRQPDPVLGAGLSRERGGQEQVLALTASLPLSGAYRRAGWQVADSQTQLALQRVDQVRQRLMVDVADQRRAFELTSRQWQQLRQSRQALEQQAALMDKAYALGEVTLNDWLLSMRRSSEARALEDTAQVERMRLYSLILLNGHRLWASAEHDASVDQANSPISPAGHFPESASDTL